MMRWKKFDTGVTDRNIINSVLHVLKDERKKAKNGKEFLSDQQIGIQHGITEQDVLNIETAKKAADAHEVKGYLLSGNTYSFDDGTIGRNYSRAGVIMVEAIEDAYERLNFNVKITGEYLCGKTWGDCH